MEIREPQIRREEILFVQDPEYHQGNVCIVTGVSTGIGRASAVAAATNGLTVIGLDVNEQEGQATASMAEEMGGSMIFVQCDLTRDDEVVSAVDQAAEQGAIKFLLNIAGVQHIDPVESFPMDKYDLMMSLMLRAPFLLSKLTIPHMRASETGTGAIGNMASAHAHISTRNKPVYNMTKFGLRGLSQSIAAEGEGRIRSFTVSTGYVKTPLALNQIPDQARQRNISQEEVVRDVMLGTSRVKDMMNPVEVANLFLFGMSRHGRHLVGGDLLFDGGMVLTY